MDFGNLIHVAPHCLSGIRENVALRPRSDDINLNISRAASDNHNVQDSARFANPCVRRARHGKLDIPTS